MELWDPTHNRTWGPIILAAHVLVGDIFCWFDSIISHKSSITWKLNQITWINHNYGTFSITWKWIPIFLCNYNHFFVPFFVPIKNQTNHIKRSCKTQISVLNAATTTVGRSTHGREKKRGVFQGVDLARWSRSATQRGVNFFFRWGELDGTNGWQTENTTDEWRCISYWKWYLDG